MDEEHRSLSNRDSLSLSLRSTSAGNVHGENQAPRELFPETLVGKLEVYDDRESAHFTDRRERLVDMVKAIVTFSLHRYIYIYIFLVAISLLYIPLIRIGNGQEISTTK